MPHVKWPEGILQNSGTDEQVMLNILNSLSVDLSLTQHILSPIYQLGR